MKQNRMNDQLFDDNNSPIVDRAILRSASGNLYVAVDMGDTWAIAEFDDYVKWEYQDESWPNDADIYEPGDAVPMLTVGGFKV